jgi:hypothetical protein
MNLPWDMTMTFVVAACVFAAVLGTLVACVDWWREARLALIRPPQRVRVSIGRVASVPAPRKRAA